MAGRKGADMNRIALGPIGHLGALAGLVMLSGLAALPAGAADGGTIILVDLFGARAGWALESDDAFVLTKAGCMEMLTRVDFDGTLKPGLATAWTQSAPSSWDFTLRSGVTFADGHPLDAAAVVGALDRALHVAAPARSFSPRLVSAVTAVDDHTVRITTPGPSVLVPLRMASPNTGILSPAAFKGERVDPVRACTGPFTVVADVPGQGIKLERNANYWGGPVGYARAELRYVPDGQVRATMAQTGEAQIAAVLPVTALRTPPASLAVIAKDLPRVTSLYLNDAKPPLDDVRVRQAIQAALDISAIAGSVYEGLARPAVGPFAPDEPWAPASTAPIAQDLARARSLLAAAGIAPGSLTIELLTYAERPELADLASVIQAELGEVGIAVTIRTASYSALEPALLAGNFQAMLLSRSHLTDMPDPGAFLTADYTCKGAYNISHFCRPEIDAKLEGAVALPDPAQRFAIYGEVAATLQRDAASVFLIREQQRDAVSATVRGFRMHPLGHYILTKDLAPAP